MTAFADIREIHNNRFDYDGGQVSMVPLDRLFSGKSQLRKVIDESSVIRLADSIRHYGILHPLTVRKIIGTNFYGTVYEIVSGERRFRAAKLLCLPAVPCFVIEANNLASAELSIIENIHREDLNMFEQAGAIASLIDMYGLTQEEAAQRLSVSQSYIANKLRVLRLTLPERKKVLNYGLTERHVRALIRVASPEQRLRIIEYINKYSLNVATTESYIDRFLSENTSARNTRAPRKIVLKDIRVFYNSIDRALSMVKQAGVDVSCDRMDTDLFTELTIRIPKSSDVSRETLGETTC